jgi:hypothetical protein
MTVRHGQAAVVVGSKRPAMSISWTPRSEPGGVDFFIIFFADLLPDDPGFDDLPSELVCLHCLIEDGDAELAEGLELAQRHGQVDWDAEAGEWFVPKDAQVNES